MPTTEVILGFDVGSKRIGIAVGQSITQSANPIAVLSTGDAIPWKHIDKLVNQWRPTTFVVGLPIQADQQLGNIGKRAQKFAQLLEERYIKPTHLIDEHLSTKSAISVQKDATMKAKLGIDAFAAKLIIETWLTQQN